MNITDMLKQAIEETILSNKNKRKLTSKTKEKTSIKINNLFPEEESEYQRKILLGTLIVVKNILLPVIYLIFAIIYFTIDWTNIKIHI